jgi:long-chain fatty acid transport protein
MNAIERQTHGSSETWQRCFRCIPLKQLINIPMKKEICLLVAVVLFFAGIPAIAQIDNLTNLSPEWVRTGARNASLDGTDIMMYNPGGVCRLPAGLHVTVGNQSSFRKPQHSYTLPDLGAGASAYSYKQDGNDLLTPNINFSYNKENWAIYGGVNIVAGGGEANFPTGSISTDLVTFSTLFALNMQGYPYTNGKDGYLKASSYDMAYSVGGSYALNQKLSVGLTMRYVSGINKSQLGMTIQDAAGNYPDLPMSFQSEDHAGGLGFVLGVDMKATDKLNLSMRYESRVSMEYKTDSIHDDFGFIADGEKNHRDLPGVFGFGLSYDLTEKTKVLCDFNYYFQQNADWGKTTTAAGDVSTSSLAGNASTYALAVEYKFHPKFIYSMGASYAMFSFKDKENYFSNLGAYEIAPGNNVSISTGFAYNITDKTRINLGYTRAMYSDQDIRSANYAAAGMDVNVHTSNTISIIGVGVDFAF